MIDGSDSGSMGITVAIAWYSTQLQGNKHPFKVLWVLALKTDPQTIDE